VDIAFTRDIRSIEDAPEYLRPQFEKHWSYVHTVEWWVQHWEKTGLVDVQCAELLPESKDLLQDYVRERSQEQDEDSIMRAVRQDRDGLIALFCLVAWELTRRLITCRLNRLMSRNQYPGFATALSRWDYYIVILCCFDSPFAHNPANLDNRHATFDSSHH
jgi:hypothetical protein